METSLSLSALMEEVVRIGSERHLAHLRLLEDPFYQRLQEGVYRQAIDFALAAGQEAAELAKQRHGQRADQIAAALRVPVIYRNEAVQAGPSVLLSEYRSRPPSIILYTSPMGEVDQLIAIHGLEDLLGLAEVTPVHLAHELYHHLEAKKLTPGTSGFRIQTGRLGPLRFHTGLPSLSEIAADRFATTILSLKVPPGVLSFITLHRLDADYAWRQLSRLQSLPVG